MEVSSSTVWKLEETIATCGGPSRFWSIDARQPDAGVSLRLLGGNPPTTDSEPTARVFALSMEGQPAQPLRLCDVFAKRNHLYSRYEDWTTGNPREGLDIHVGLTAIRIAAESRGEGELPEQGEEYVPEEEYVLEAVISARTESLRLERDVRIGFQGRAEDVSWRGVALADAGRRTATLPLPAHEEPTDSATVQTAGIAEFSFPVVELPGSSSVLGLLVHPAGICPLNSLEPVVPLMFDFRNGRFSLVYRLFPLRLEKGVEVRGAFQLLLLHRAGATQRLSEAAERFLSSPPPLTEE